METQVAAEFQQTEVPEPLRRFITFEQANLYKPWLYRRAQTADIMFEEKYLPENRSVFRLPCFWVKRKHFYAYDWKGGSGAAAQGHEGSILFPIHPSEFARCAEFLASVKAEDASVGGVRFMATPTSSARTLLAWPEGQRTGAFCVKLSLHSLLFGDRKLSRRKVAGSVGTSVLLSESAAELPQGIAYFPEIAGLVPRAMSDSGAILRSIPDEINSGRVVPAPLFSLIGCSEGHRPLLLELMERERQDVRGFLEDVLLARFARIWIELVFDCGLILEAHGQDLLLALSQDLVPLGGFYYRDFEGLTVDWVLRRARGLKSPETLPHAFEWFSTYETWGYPMYQLLSIKIKTSLFDYMSLVLRELEMTLLEWQRLGLVGSGTVREGELTFFFSRYLRGTIREKFGLAEDGEYDIQQDLVRFVKFLMRVRREVVVNGASLALF